MKYPKSVAAARNYEKSSLALGDALAEECRNDKAVAEAYDEMVDNGIATLSYRRCCELRVVSSAFTPAARRSLNANTTNELSVKALEAAGDPKTMRKILDHAPEGQRITENYVRAKVREMTGIPTRGQSSERERLAVEIAASVISEADSVLAALSRLQDLLSQWEIDQTTTDYVVDRMLTASKTAREISEDVRKGVTNRRSHLQVV